MARNGERSGRGRHGDGTTRRSGDDSFVSPCLKWSMFIFNFVFWLVGCTLMAVGAYAYIENQSMSSGENVHDTISSVFDLLLNVSIVLLFVGAFVFVLAFSGCLGSLRENTCLLMFFAITLGIIFFIEVIAIILAFVYSSQAKTKLSGILQTEAIDRYTDEKYVDLANIIDWFQKNLQCCGISEAGYLDWNSNVYFNCTAMNPSAQKCSVPPSCCRSPNQISLNVINTMCGYGVQALAKAAADMKVYTRGCLDAVVYLIENNLYVVGGIAVAIVVPQLVGVLLARILTGQIRDQRARWSQRSN